MKPTATCWQRDSFAVAKGVDHLILARQPDVVAGSASERPSCLMCWERARAAPTNSTACPDEARPDVVREALHRSF